MRGDLLKERLEVDLFAEQALTLGALAHLGEQDPTLLEELAELALAVGLKRALDVLAALVDATIFIGWHGGSSPQSA